MALEADVGMSGCRYELSPLQSGLAVSSSLLGALAGSAGAFAFGEKLGRRRELLLAAACYGRPNKQMNRSINIANFFGHASGQKPFESAGCYEAWFLVARWLSEKIMPDAC